MPTRKIPSLLLVLLAAPLFAQKPAVRQIEIMTGWGGLGAARDGKVSIVCNAGSCRYGTSKIGKVKIDALVDALQQAPLARVTVETAGIGREWLKAHVNSAQKSALGYREGLPEQVALFQKTFTDPASISNVLPDLFGYTKFDDYPSARVQVTFDDGRKITAVTRSYYVFMVPWKIEGKETWNPAISRAVSDLLPDKTADKERLRGGELETQLAENVMRQIEPEWKLMGAEAKAGSALKRIREGYGMSQVDINSYHSEMFGRSWDEKGPHEENLHAVLRKQSYPKNFQIQLILEYAEGKILGMDEFFANESKYETLARSVPWLNQYLAQHPKVTATLYQVHGHSFGAHAMETFAKDMKKRQREDLVARVSALQDEIALLDIGSGLWLVFPDHSMILWRYEMKPGLLKWTVKDFPEAECGDYRSNYGGCSGREVSASGALLEDRLPADAVCMKAWRATKPYFAAPGEALFPVTQHDRTGYIDVHGKIRIPLCYESAGDFSEGVAAFERDKLFGYIDTAGSIVIEPKFLWAEKFAEGLAFVQASGSQLGYDGKWGYSDHDGRLAIPAIYQQQYGGEDGAAFHEGRALVYTGTAYGYVDKSGKEIIPPRFTYAAGFADGLAVATEDERGEHWGAIDRSGVWQIRPTVAWLGSFSEGVATAGRSSNCGFINHNGEIVLRPDVPSGEKDCATVYGAFSGGLARWRRGSKFGYIDKTGKWVIEPKYDLTFGFSDGLAAVQMGKQWGYINPAGQMVIPLHEWTTAGEFHNGAARIVTKSGVAYIDKSGKYIWGPTPQTD